MGYKKPVTDEEKQAARDAANAKSEKLMAQIGAKLADLSAALAAGQSAELLAYLNFASQFWRYSANNQFLIMLQAPQAQRVAGFQAWKKVGRSVNKGAKAVYILRPLLVNDFEQPAQASGKPAQKMVGFGYVSVFADHDTNGAEMLGNQFMTVQGGDDQTRALVAELSEKSPVPVVWVRDESRSAHGWTSGGVITMNAARCEGQHRHALRILFHEWAHVFLHFEKPGVSAQNRPSKQVCELEADAAAYVLCSFYGVEATAQVSDYIQTWGGHPEALGASMGRIMQAVKSILSVCQSKEENAEDQREGHALAEAAD